MRNIINQGRQAAASATDPEKSRIEKVCNELDKLLDDLAALRRQGKVSLKKVLGHVTRDNFSCNFDRNAI